jgi:hypothetical protein
MEQGVRPRAGRIDIRDRAMQTYEPASDPARTRRGAGGIWVIS